MCRGVIPPLFSTAALNLGAAALNLGAAAHVTSRFSFFCEVATGDSWKVQLPLFRPGCVKRQLAAEILQPPASERTGSRRAALGVVDCSFWARRRH